MQGPGFGGHQGLDDSMLVSKFFLLWAILPKEA